MMKAATPNRNRRQLNVAQWLIQRNVCFSMAEARRLCESGIVTQKGHPLQSTDIPPINPVMEPIMIGKYRKVH